MVPKHDDLIPLIDILNWVENTNVTNGMPFLGSPLLSRGGPLSAAGPPPMRNSPRCLPAIANTLHELDEYAQKKGVAFFSCTLSFYGAAAANAANWEFAKEKFSSIPGARFVDGQSFKLPLTDEQKEKVNVPQFGIPSLRMFSIGARSETNPTPGNGHIGSRRSSKDGRGDFEANACLPRPPRN